MDLREVLDGLGSEDFGDDVVARSRARVLAGVAGMAEFGVTAHAVHGRRQARGRQLPRRGVFAAVAAVIVVALVAVGAFVTAQWLGKAPTAGDPRVLDLSAPLLEQLEPGEYLRVERTTVAGAVIGLPEGVPSDDSYVVVRSVDALYLSPSEPWTAVTDDRPQQVIETSGPDGQEMASLVAEPATPHVVAANIPAPGWRAGLADDAGGLLDAFRERYPVPILASGAAGEEMDGESLFWLSILEDPAWYAISVAQRQTILDAVLDGGSSTTRDDRSDGDVELTFGDYMSAVLDGRSLLPQSGRTANGDVGPRETTWSVELSVVAEARQPPEPAHGGYWCADQHVPQAALEVPTYAFADALDSGKIAALTEAGLWTTIEMMPEAWIVVSSTDTELVLLTTQPTMEAGWLLDGAPPDHQVVVLHRSDGRWSFGDERLCALQRDDLGALVLADVELDPAHPPQAGDGQVHFLVTERECNSGRQADGRVERASSYYDGIVLEVRIGIRPTGQPGDCPDNPPTPFVLELTSPWVEGTIVRDMTYVDPRELPLP